MLKYVESERVTGKMVLTCCALLEDGDGGSACTGTIFSFHKFADGTYLECAVCGETHNIPLMNEA